MSIQVANKNTESCDRNERVFNSVSLLSEQKIREFVAKHKQSEYKSNTKKLC
jgi:hypothetical protein